MAETVGDERLNAVAEKVGDFVLQKLAGLSKLKEFRELYAEIDWETVKLDTVMPYPIKTGIIAGIPCRICLRKIGDHEHVDWFAEEAHVQGVRRWMQNMTEDFLDAESVLIHLRESTKPGGGIPTVSEQLQTYLQTLETHPEQAQFLVEVETVFFEWIVPVLRYQHRFVYDLESPFNKMKEVYNNTVQRFLRHKRRHPTRTVLVKAHGVEAEYWYTYIHARLSEIQSKASATKRFVQSYAEKTDNKHLRELGSRRPEEATEFRMEAKRV